MVVGVGRVVHHLLVVRGMVHEPSSSAASSSSSSSSPRAFGPAFPVLADEDGAAVEGGVVEAFDGGLRLFGVGGWVGGWVGGGGSYCKWEVWVGGGGWVGGWDVPLRKSCTRQSHSPWSGPRAPSAPRRSRLWGRERWVGGWLSGDGVLETK